MDAQVRFIVFPQVTFQVFKPTNLYIILLPIGLTQDFLLVLCRIIHDINLETSCYT